MVTYFHTLFLVPPPVKKINVKHLISGELS